MSYHPRLVLATLALLGAQGCDRAPDPPLNDEAPPLLAAIDAVREAPVTAKAAPLAHLRSVSVTQPALQVLREQCLRAYEDYVRVQEGIAAWKQRRATSSAPADDGTELAALDALEIELKRAGEGTAACTEAQSAQLRRAAPQ